MCCKYFYSFLSIVGDFITIIIIIIFIFIIINLIFIHSILKCLE